MLCLLTLITCAHACSFYFEFCYFAGSESWTSLCRFACFAQLGAHMTRSRGSPPLNFDGGPRGPPIKIWGGRALICALWFALLICVICWKWRSLINWLAGWLASLLALLAQIAWLSNLLNWLFAWLLALLCFDLTMRSYWLGSTCFACAHACSLCFGLPFFSSSDILTSP